MIALIAPLTGCVTRVKTIDANRQVITVHCGVPFTPPTDGKFVPASRFEELLDVYERHSFEK